MNNKTIWVNEPLVVIIIFIFLIVIVIFIIIIVIIIPWRGLQLVTKGYKSLAISQISRSCSS